MTIKLVELADEVRILELEARKLELENRITQLKSEQLIDGEYIDLQEELDECHETIKQQNQTLLRISAELGAIKQYDPLDLVLIAGSIKNISNITEGQTEQSIDDECVGCCKVVDVAANLQKELDACQLVIRNFKAIETRETDRLRKTIEELKDQNIDDLRELYDLYEAELNRFKHTISARDLSIKSLTSICQSSGTTRNELASTIDDLNSQLTEKRAIINEITRLRVNEVETRQALEAELSARKEDSAVLMKVVEVIRDDTIPNFKVPCMICSIVDDYLDAPEGPPETPIDEPQEITVTVAFLELP